LASIPAHHDYVYLTHIDSNFISIIDGTIDTIVRSINVGDKQFALAYDTRADAIYATKPSLNSVALIDASTNNVINPDIRVGEFPTAIAYDPVNGHIYVANSKSNTTCLRHRKDLINIL
jgi:DNA-binding beta-propeller fold protein YncE